MRFISLFSGIEAASAAWLPIGWECVAVAEIEPFPCAVLAHHYPAVRNLGDITQITQEQVEALGHIDAIVLGFPCQDVSIAGQRQGFKNADGTLTRSGLFFTALRIIEWSKARWTIGENVPGLFSSHEGRDFASVVGELSGTEIDVPRDGWRTAGVALGPKGLVEWFVLDAQYTRVASHPRAVPQRRRRVFIVRDSGNWQGRPPIFLIPQSLRGNPPPRREAGKGPTGTLAARTKGGGGLGTDFDLGGGLTTVQCGEIVPQAMSSKWSKGTSGPAGDEVRDLVAHSVSPGDARTLLGKANSSHADDQETYVAHSLTGEGFDASEDGSGRATPIVPIHCFDARQADVLQYGQISGPMDTGFPGPTIAFSCKDHGADAGEVTPTLRSMGHDGSHANGGGQIAVAFDTTQITSKANRSNPQPGDPCHPITSEGHPPAIAFRAAGQDGFTPSDVAAYTIEARAEVQAVMTLAIRGRGDSHQIETREDGTANAILTPNGGRAGIGVGANCARMAVRRLTPLECERLQGFPDNYTKIPSPFVRKLGIPLDVLDPENPKHWAADGPRYKALGNSMATNCMRWLGQRIQELHTL